METGEQAEDFRTRAAHRKRERMRGRLLAATMEVCGGFGPAEHAVVEDVIRAAGVSRGTFYKYFDSLEEAKEALGRELVDEMVAGLGAMFAGVDDPRQRAASGTILTIGRAAQDPVWGSFVARTEHLAEESVLIATMRANTLNGIERGVFRIPSAETAIDVQLGIALQGMRHAARQPENPRDYILDMAALSLRAMGVPAKSAAAVARRAMADIVARAPDHLAWWRGIG